MWFYSIRMKLYSIRKLLIWCVLLFVVLPMIAIGGALLHLKMEYNYKPESIADFIYTLRNPPEHYYLQQNIESYKLENGFVVRTDRVRSVKDGIITCESFGIPSKFGTYYFTDYEVGIEFQNSKSTKYKYDDDANIIGKDITESLAFYLSIGRFHVIMVYSNKPEVSDSSNSPSVTISRGGKYFIYLFPPEITEEYTITINGDVETGEYILYLIDNYRELFGSLPWDD